MPDPEQEGRLGTVLADRYRLMKVLGGGGVGHVYLAEHVGIGKKVAVKVLSARFAQHSELRSRFVREAKATSQIAHENVVDITDFGDTPDGSVFMAMEYLDGEDLSQTIKNESPFKALRAKRVVLQILRALHAAHEHGILHRDMKPENCFRIKRGANRDFIKVLDFGLAKLTHERMEETGNNLTQAGAIFGTPHYMSPEQCRGEPADFRSDVYSVGVMLYEMATGMVPFDDDNMMKVIAAHAFEKPMPPGQANPNANISDPMQSVILKAMAKDRDHRFQTIREFAEALAGVPDEGLRTGPVSHLGTPVPEQLDASANVPAVVEDTATDMRLFTQRETVYRIVIGAQAAFILILILAHLLR